MTKQEREKLRKLCEKAPKWLYPPERVGFDDGSFSYELNERDAGLVSFSELNFEVNPMRAKFAAELFYISRTAIPQLLDALDDAEKEIERLKEIAFRSADKFPVMERDK